MKPIQTPDGVKDQRRFRQKATHYTMLNGALYKRGFGVPLLRYVDLCTAEEILEEFHEGTYGTHEGPCALASWILHYDYYWPKMHQEAKDFISRCDKC